jgi:hypothetical protein
MEYNTYNNLRVFNYFYANYCIQLSRPIVGPNVRLNMGSISQTKLTLYLSEGKRSVFT